MGRQPRLSVPFGVPVPLDDLDAGPRGDAHRAARRIVAAITAGLAPLRSHEAGPPRYRDPTRPVVRGGTAAFPGGLAPLGLFVPRWTAEGQAERVPA